MLECEAVSGSKLMDIIAFSSATTIFRAVAFFYRTAGITEILSIDKGVHH